MKLLKILILSLTISCSQMGKIGDLFEDPEIARLQKESDRNLLVSLINGGRTGLNGTSGTNGSTGTLSDVSVSVKRTTDQTIANGTYTYISFDATNFDTSNFFNSGNPTYVTIPSNGLYQIKALVSYAANTTGNRKGNLLIESSFTYVVSSVSYAASGTGTAGVSFSVDSTTKLLAGDKVYLQLYQDSGSNIVVSGNSYSLVMTVVKLNN